MLRFPSTAGASLLAVAFVFATPAAADEINATKTRLEACALQHIATEKTKQKPNAKAVLKACRIEAREFYATLPPGMAPEFRKHVEHVIQHRLDQ